MAANSKIKELVGLAEMLFTQVEVEITINYLTA